MTKWKYPKTVAACGAAIKSKWIIGDALIEECGPPSERGENDGSYDRMEDVADEISKAWGYEEEYLPISLSEYRRVAYAFGTCRRHVHLSWSVHREAGTPENLERIIKSTPKDQKITTDYVRDIMKQLRQKQRARSGSGSKSKSGSTAKSKSSGRQSKNSKLGGVILLTKFRACSNEAIFKIENLMKELEPMLDTFDDEDINILSEGALEVFNTWKRIVELLRSKQKGKRGHLQVIK